MPTPTLLSDALAAYAPIHLDAMGDAALLARYDRKFLLPARQLDEFLAACQPDYRVLTISDRRVHRYVTRYFDTDDFALYHAHHAGRAVRAKVRLRSYADTDEHFLEVKHRLPGGRTSKLRSTVTRDTDDAMASAVARSLDAPGMIPPRSLHGVVTVCYHRATLVSRENAERVTVDIGLELQRDTHAATFPGVACVEIKQSTYGPSTASAWLRTHQVREGLLSKYCLAVATLLPQVRSNRFRPAIERLERLSRDAMHPMASPA